jgi:hypothetical protein
LRETFGIFENFWIPLLLAGAHFDKSKELNGPKRRKSYEKIVMRFNPSGAAA